VTVTTKGYQGTLSDVDLATQFPHHAPCVYGLQDLIVAAVAGSRSVTVGAGSAVSAFVKYTSDASQTLNLAPPASGGKFYAITLDRQWSPTSTATLKADDLAVTDGTGTAPVYPGAAITAAQALPDQPGTAGSTAGQRQVLALVYVRAADTTLTIYDTRLVRTSSGVLRAVTLHAVAFANAKLLDGAVLEISSNATNSGIINRAEFARNGGTMQPRDVVTVTSNGTGGWMPGELVAAAAAYPSAISLPPLDTYVRDMYAGSAANSGVANQWAAAGVTINHLTYRYNGNGNNWTRWEGSGGWTAPWDGYAFGTESGWWDIAAGVLTAHAFGSSGTNDVLQTQGTQLLNMPTQPAEGHGLPWVVGTCKATRASDFTTWAGELLQNGGQGYKCMIGLFRVDSGGGRLWITGPSNSFPDGQGGGTRFYWELHLRFIV
jgi:hypothetical protein